MNTNKKYNKIWKRIYQNKNIHNFLKRKTLFLILPSKDVTSWLTMRFSIPLVSFKSILGAIASILSMNKMQGAILKASSKISLILLSDSPDTPCTSSVAATSSSGKPVSYRKWTQSNNFVKSK